MMKSRKMRWVGHVARVEERNVYMVMVVEGEGKETTW
jgi:hypothetical protein